MDNQVEPKGTDNTPNGPLFRFREQSVRKGKLDNFVPYCNNSKQVTNSVQYASFTKDLTNFCHICHGFTVAYNLYGLTLAEV